MENQVENCSSVSPKALIVLVGVVFAALIAFVVTESFLGTLAGAVIGLIAAAVFNGVFYKQTPHDR
ncbi:hypothetical protein J5U18_11770 [Sphingobacteriaceae bacterium WQ 2009]|uniref:Uncharacterized protein n=1 Tax=Rhinopithecimicrobium faecis TaxID=2820698 RepID=A0A8T4HCN3_9SPHI|nr:hypothetical protein [Sphingobacteriaceae bacterium WQ 2009]